MVSCSGSKYTRYGGYKRLNTPEVILPDAYYSSIYLIDYDSLYCVGIRLIVFDVDDTLAGASDQCLSEQAIALLHDLASKGFEIVFLSNTIVPWRAWRVRRLAKQTSLPIPTICCGVLDRKPGKKAFNKACIAAGLGASQAVMIGDQLRKDIIGGQRAGFVQTILVDPRGEEGWVSKLIRTRKKEAPLKANVVKRGLFRR